MLISRFHDGGYVVHRITGAFKGRASAWFGPDGTMLDAEQIIGSEGRSRPIKAGGPLWQHCQRIGRRVFDSQINVVQPAICSRRFDIA